MQYIIFFTTIIIVTKQKIKKEKQINKQKQNIFSIFFIHEKYA